MPDVGETVLGMLPKSDAPPPFDVSADGFAFFKKEAYVPAFAPDVGGDLGDVHGSLADSVVHTRSRHRAAQGCRVEGQAELVRGLD